MKLLDNISRSFIYKSKFMKMIYGLLHQFQLCKYFGFFHSFNSFNSSLGSILYFSFNVLKHTDNYPCYQQFPIEIYLYIAINNQMAH